ncbi:MAG TPA: glycosyltransferase, partial [Gaiellaceae bacterium]|nr:glycosyltransferase [Gaiellaceae bacterium]
RFVFLYSGTLGFKHDPSLLLELARWAAGHDSVVVVVSEGPGSDWLAREGADEPGLLLLPYQPYERLPEVLASADVLLALLEPDAGSFSVPSKVLTYLCAARPLLVSVSGDNLAARVVVRSGGGLVVPPKDPEALLAAAAALHADASRRAELGRSARAYAERTFDLERIADRFEQVLAALVAAEAGRRDQEDRGAGEHDQQGGRA